jgi:hypothetical protein
VAASTIRTVWHHLPMMLNAGLPWLIGTVGNAAFTMVPLQLLVARSSSGSDARTDDFGVATGSVRVRAQQRHTDAGR